MTIFRSMRHSYPQVSRFLRHTHQPAPYRYRAAQITVALCGLVGMALALVFLPLRSLFLLISTITTAIILLRHPWLVWVGIGLVLPIISGIRIGLLSLADVALAAAFFLWFINGVRQRRLQIVIIWPLALLLLYCAALALSLLQATDLIEAVTEVLKWIQFAMVLLVVPAMVPRRFVHWLIIGLLSGAILQALLGLYQFIFRIGPEWFIILGRFMRASGSFGQPNPYGGYLGLSLPVAFSLALWSLTQHWRPQFQEAGAGKRMHWQLLWTSFTVGAAVAIALGLLASWSRGGWLGMVGSSFTVLLLRSKWVAAWLGTFGAILAVTLLFGAVQPQWVPAPIAARFEEIPAYFGLTDLLQQPVTDENFAIIERLAHWDAALRMWDRAPWLGIGPGNYATIYPEVNLPQWEEALGHAHNIYLNMLAEGGLLGFFAYLLLWSSILFWLGQQLRRAQLSPVWQAPQWTIPLLIGVIGVVVHLSIHNFFDNLFVQGNYLHIAMWLVVARIAVGRENHKFS